MVLTLHMLGFCVKHLNLFILFVLLNCDLKDVLLIWHFVGYQHAEELAQSSYISTA